jgi:hypothetical protein
MAMSGLGGGNPSTIWGWPLHYFLAVRREFLAANNIVAPGGGSGQNAGEKVVRRENRGSFEVVHYERS